MPLIEVDSSVACRMAICVICVICETLFLINFAYWIYSGHRIPLITREMERHDDSEECRILICFATFPRFGEFENLNYICNAIRGLQNTVGHSADVIYCRCGVLP